MAVLQQRPLRGSRISSFYPVKNLPSLSSLDSAFQLQEYISLLIRLDVHDVEAIVSLPGKSSGKEKEKEKERIDEENGDEKSTEEKEGEKDRKVDVAVDEACWIYEHLRRLAQDLSHPLITTLQQECTRASCPEMKAGEWLYLCVAHGNDGAMEQCCAIDYILHTVDSATALLNSPRTFPSRLQIPQTSHRHFSALARRLGRIFAHAYFHHREAFEQAEAESSLYARFLALTSKFDLVPSEFLVIPQNTSHSENDSRDEVQPPRLLAAAVDPSSHSRNQNEARDESSFHDPVWDRRGSVVGPGERAKSNSPPGLGNGNESPRKFGRNRTDTMVFSDVSAVAEDLAKVNEDPIEGTTHVLNKDEKEIEKPNSSSEVSSTSTNSGVLHLTPIDLLPLESESSPLPSPPETAKPSPPETQKSTEEESAPAVADDHPPFLDTPSEDSNSDPTPLTVPMVDTVAIESDPPIPVPSDPEQEDTSSAVPSGSDPTTEPNSEQETAEVTSSTASESQSEATAEINHETERGAEKELEGFGLPEPESTQTTAPEVTPENVIASAPLPEALPSLDSNENESPEEPVVGADTSVTDATSAHVPAAPVAQETELELTLDDTPSLVSESVPTDTISSESPVTSSASIEEKEPESAPSEGQEL